MEDIIDIDVIVRIGKWQGELYPMAICPAIADTYDMATCGVIDQIDGHNGASMDWWRSETRTPLASEHAMVAEFLAWLESLGYRVRRMRKVTTKHNAERLAQIRHP